MKNLLKNPFLQGGIYMMAANVIMGGMNYVFNVVSGRLLGPEGYGNVTTLFAYMAVLTIPLAAISNVLIQKIGAQGDNKIVYAYAIEQWTYNQFKKYWYIIIAFLVLIPFTPWLTNLTPFAAYSIIPLFFISIIATVYDGILTGMHKFFLASGIGVIAVLIKLGGALLGYVVPNALIAVIVLFDVSLIIKVILDKVALVSILKPAQRKDDAKIKKTIMSVLHNKQFLLTIGSILAISLINNVDMIYAKKAFSAENAGLFAGWALFAKVIIYVFGPLLTMSYVFFSSKKQGMYHHIVLIVSFVLLVAVGIALNIGYGMYDRQLINLLLGEKYLPLKPFIEWAALFGIGYVMVMFMNNYFLAKASKATLILPIMTTIYFPALLYFGRELGQLIFFNTVFMFLILLLYLLMFFKDRIVSLLE
ncbi:hypothetical protein BH09PAT2_BH09PAT2_02440 [soil metagenome]